MAIQEPIDTQDFLTSFKRFMDKAAAQVPVEEPIFLRNYCAKPRSSQQMKAMT